MKNFYYTGKGPVMDFENRSALVTGGAGALGRAVTLDLLRAGARVAVPYFIEEEWSALRASVGKNEERLTGGPVDLTKSTEVALFVQNVVAQIGHLDFLICLAGGFAPGKSFETDDATWERMLGMNLRSAVTMLREAVPGMIRQNFGRIVTVSSGAILRGGGAGLAAYAVSKGAVHQLTEILADEVKRYNIHAHCIMPGTLDTEANRRAMPEADRSQWVKTEDVARVIHFLLSEQANAVRSVVVPVLG
jgi:NAD(P)-dependent dehydrogenase (short-subunit alcohol dehydrogenase family)